MGLGEVNVPYTKFLSEETLLKHFLGGLDHNITCMV